MSALAIMWCDAAARTMLAWVIKWLPGGPRKVSKMWVCRRSSEGREAEGAPAAPAASYEEDEYEEECTDFDPYAFIKNLPPLQQARLLA